MISSFVLEITIILTLCCCPIEEDFGLDFLALADPGRRCQLVFEQSAAKKIFAMPTIPRSLSIFSIDRYLGQGTPYPKLSEANTSRQFLSENVVAKMDPATQQLFVVPGLFGDADLKAGGSMVEQSLGLRKKLLDYWRWL